MTFLSQNIWLISALCGNIRCPPFTDLTDPAKMIERKRNRNVQTSNARDGFHISREPLVDVIPADRIPDVGDSIGFTREYGARILFAIARDPRTIFASWNIDWSSLFERVVPVDRQVHLRLYGADGLEEKTMAVEPMAAMHYVTTSGSHALYRVEIGYYQPADVWHSVAISHDIAMPSTGVAETADVDLATIPLHVAFQQLLNLFKPATETRLAMVMSQFQKRALSSERPKALSGDEKKLLRELQVSVFEIAAGWRAFNKTEGKKLTRRTGALLSASTTSPSRGFEGDGGSAGS
ncbi:MAG: DUF4912 domain-containing protein [Limisphaerales bacterium]